VDIEHPYATRIVTPQEVLGVVTALLRYGTRGTLVAGDQRYPAVGTLLETAEPAIAWSVATRIPETELVGELYGYNSVFRMALPVLAANIETILTALPVEVMLIRRRWTRRVLATRDERVVLPTGGGTRTMTMPLLDLAYGGFSFVNDPHAGLRLEPGTAVSNMRVVRAGNAAVIDADVVELTHAPRPVCRMRVRQTSGGVPADWHRLVDRVLHPETSTDPAFTKDLWQLYGDCGYFSLSSKDPSCFSDIEADFFTVADRLASHPDLGCHVVWPSRRGVSAGLSVMKTYGRGWLGFQMAKITGETPEGVPGRRVLREIHNHAYEHIQAVDPSPGYIIGYPQVKNIWSRAPHYDLPKRYEVSGAAHVTRFRALEFDTRRGIAAPAAFTICSATRTDCASLAAHLETIRPMAYREALDLVADRLDLAGIRSQWANAGLVRDRHILIARHGRRAVAAAIVESASRATHVYRLLDLVRLYALEPAGTQGFPDLLEAAREQYARSGKSAFVLFQEEDMPLPEQVVSPAYDMGYADQSILSAAHLPELLEYVFEITARRFANTDPLAAAVGDANSRRR
jgi:hypothetical protein